MMNLDHFSDLLDIHGSDPARWPPTERGAALALVQVSSAARQLLDDATRLEKLLAGAPVPEPSTDLAARILAQLPPVSQPVRATMQATSTWQDFFAALFPFRTVWPQFAALALALSIGVGLGLGGIEEIIAEESAPYAVQLVIANTSFLPE